MIRESGGLLVVNEVPLEDYVAGTVLGEVSEGFGDAVLRAQAVAIRTYALHQRAEPRSPNYDVEAGTRSQVYLGLDGETAAARAAVDATRGQILTFDGEPILAAFHSAAGGRTATAAEVWGRDVPYLVSVGVPGEEDSPDTYWRAPFSATELGDALAAAGQDVGTRARRRGRASGRRAVAAPSSRVRGSEGTAKLSGETLRRALGQTRAAQHALRGAAHGRRLRVRRLGQRPRRRHEPVGRPRAGAARRGLSTDPCALLSRARASSGFRRGTRASRERRPLSRRMRPQTSEFLQ